MLTNNTCEIEEQIRKLERMVSFDIKEFTVEVLVNKLSIKEIFVPFFQRRYVWKLQQAQKFIESVLLGIPIPFIFCADVNDGTLEIIDGVQRLKTLELFLNDQLILDNLEKVTLLKGEIFSDLPMVYQRRFKNRTIRVIVLNESVDEGTRLDLFHRINTSSVKLNDAELRSGTFSSRSFYNFIAKMSDNDLFHKLCPLSLDKVQRREREELVSRFFAYFDKYKEFNGDVRKFIFSYISEQTNKQLEDYQDIFNRMLQFVEENLPSGFAKSKGAKSTPRVRFEALSVGIALALKEKPLLQKVDMEPLLKSNEFKIATTTDASNLPKRLCYRIELVRDYLLKGTLISRKNVVND